MAVYYLSFKCVSSNSGEFPPVKSRFLKLNSEHIGYVIDSLKSNTDKIDNIKAYTLAALYNAPVYGTILHIPCQPRYGA